MLDRITEAIVIVVAVFIISASMVGITYTLLNWTYDDEAGIEQRITCTTDQLVRFNDRTMVLECVTVFQLSGE